jgi:hypothetical protein
MADEMDRTDGSDVSDIDERDPRLVAFFTDGQRALEAAEKLTRDGFAVEEVFGPYPLHEADSALGRRRSRLPWITLVAGTFGALSALGFQFYTAVIDWPMNVGGKPANSTLAFIPITFELTVLCAGLATAGVFLAVSRLVPRLRPPRWLPGVTYDRFALVVGAETKPEGKIVRLHHADLRQILEESGAEEIRPFAEEVRS